MPLIDYSNMILEERCRILRNREKSMQKNEVREMGEALPIEYHPANDGCIPQTQEYPDFITTYTSGSFIVSKENILFYTKEFYESLYLQLYKGEKGVDRTCGILEYLWTTLWGGKRPFQENPDMDRWCGPLYFADVSPNGFIFKMSEDKLVEKGLLPEGYYGSIQLA